MSQQTNNKQQTTATTSTSSIRKTAQWAAVDKAQAAVKGGGIGCFVVPVFDEKGKETTNVVRETKSDTLCMVMVMSSEPASYNKLTGFYDQRRSSALILAPKALLQSTYKAWTNLGGRIVTRYGLTKDLNHRDILMGIGTTIPCITYLDNEEYYITRTQKWSPDVEDADDVQPEISNLAEIKASRLAESLNGKITKPTAGMPGRR